MASRSKQENKLRNTTTNGLTMKTKGHSHQIGGNSQKQYLNIKLKKILEN